MRGEKIQESLVIRFRNVEEGEQRTVVSARGTQATAQELPDVVARDVASQEQRVNVIPE